MANLTAIRDALAAQITTATGLRCDAQARDTVSPPCGVILPGQPYVAYGATMGTPGAATVNLAVLVIVSDAGPVYSTQRVLDGLLGIGDGESTSVPAAIMADPTLGGAVEWAEPVSITQYGRIQVAAVDYFGARLSVTLGAT